MKRKNILYKDLEVSRAKEIYDESCKNILANKIILAWIMKSCMKEYKDCSIRDIADHYIEGYRRYLKGKYTGMRRQRLIRERSEERTPKIRQ